MRVLCIFVVGLYSIAVGAQTVVVIQEGPSSAVLFSAHDPSHRTTIKLALNPHEVELTPDGRTAYVSNFGLLEASHRTGTPGTTISDLDVDRRVERTRFSLPEGLTAPHGLKLRPPEFHELFTNAEEGRSGMVVFNAESGTVVRTFPLPPGVHNFLFNRDGSTLFAYAIGGEIFQIDPESGQVTARLKLDSIRGLNWSANGRSLLAGGKGVVYVIDPAGLSVIRRFDNLGVGQTFHVTAMSDGRSLLAPAVLDGVVLVIDAESGSVVRRIETGSPFEVALDRDQKHAWVSNVIVPAGLFGPSTKPRDGGLVRLDLLTFKTTAISGIRDTNGVAVVIH